MRPLFLTFLSLLLSVAWLQGQTPVPVGAGSYASSIPGAENVDTDSRPVYVLNNTGQAIPTNDWWTPLILQNMYGATQYHLWAHPIDFTVESYGLGLHYATEWSGGQDMNKQMVIPAPVQIGGQGFAPNAEAVKSWGDWTVAFRLQESGSEYVDVTIGHGLPFAWLEYTGISIAQVTTDPSSVYFNDNNTTQGFPFTGDHFGFTWQGRSYAVFAPEGTRFTLNNGTVNASFAGSARYLIVAALPQSSNLSTFYQHAYAIPRGSTVEWAYSETGGTLSTTWHLETDILQGPDNGVLQGFLPHHYKYTQSNANFTDIQYLSARGQVRCATGNDFRITYAYDGVLSHLPAPETLPGKANNYNSGEMSSYLADFAATDVWRGESNTYGSGKSLTKFARFLANADVLDDPNKTTIQNKLKDALQDWFTYTPGESATYYAYMDNFKALMGFDTGYGSEEFNDHHFHYGYHVYAAGVLGMQDADFISQYGEMAKLVAKEYANWDRTDTRFPVFRNFDPWEGHSWANGGYGMNPPIGNNQESTSEAMMSWTGIIQLGLATGDQDMLSAGVFGYVTEAAATNEYWFDRDNENLPDSYGPEGKIACILGGANIEYQTFFGLNPIYVHGIQYIPVMPSSYYLVQHDKFEEAQTEFDYLRQRSVAQGYGDIGSWGTEWDNIALRYASLFNPEWSVANLSALGEDVGEAGLSYYTVYANRSLGHRAFGVRVGATNSGVFYSEDLDQYTYCAFNPTGSAQTYTVYQDGASIGSITVPAHEFYSTHTLDGDTNPNPDPDPDPQLPSPWENADIGSVAAAGSARFASGTFTVEGSGDDIWGTADEFHFVYQSLEGDGEIIARVNSVTNTHPWAKAGIMIRESLQAGARHAMTAATTQNGLAFQRRTTAGGASAHTGTNGTTPAWLRLVRAGDTFTSYYSGNGSTWTEIGSETIGMAETVYAGLATTSHADGDLATARFGNVVVQPLDDGGNENPETCGGTVNEDFAYTVATTANGSTLTFTPSRTNVGSTTLILYYSTDESATFPGYPATPGEPFPVSASPGESVYFYYTYSVPEGGERNTMGNKQSFVVGACGGNARTAATLPKKATLADETAPAVELKVYPNPSQETVYIRGVLPSAKDVIATDMSGKAFSLPYRQGAVSVSHLPKGVYQLRIPTPQGTVGRTFIKR